MQERRPALLSLPLALSACAGLLMSSLALALSLIHI